jgi:ubiquinone/menaquinone biosynthesis C-methylase UbiE
VAATEERQFLPALRFKALTPYFDAVVRVGLRERTFKARLLDQLEPARGDSVLDIGAGTGTLAIQIKERRPYARVTGLDADPEILAIARRKAADAGREVEFVEAFSNEMPFTDASFDTAVSTLFFHHLDAESKEKTFAEIVRVLAPGGELHVADYGKPPDPLQSALFLQVRAFDGFGVTAQNVRGELPAVMRAAGLDDVRSRGRLRTVFGTLELLSARRP